MNTPPEVSAAYIASTDKQRALAIALAQGMGKEEAMLAAGYSKVQSHKTPKEVLEHPRVVLLAAHYANKAIKKHEVTVERVAEEMADIALFDPKQIFGDDGKLLPIPEWPDAARRAFAGFDSQGAPKFVSKTDAAEKLAKIKGWYAADNKPTTAVFGVIVVPQKGSIDLDKATGILDVDSAGTFRIHAP